MSYIRSNNFFAPYRIYHNHMPKEDTIEMYCVKCKKSQKLDAKGVTKSVAKNGRNMVRGVCPSCGTKMVKFVA